ncbi:DMT family transporter [Sphingobium herbicidovorans]
MPPPLPSRDEHPLSGIRLRIVAMIFLAAMFALGKVISARGVALGELLFYRQALALPLILAWVAMTDGLVSVRTNRLGVHVSRTALGLTGMALNFGSYLLLPLTEATAIGFTMPIFATLLSALILRESTGPHRWAAILLGFVGIIVMIRPDSAHFPPLGLAVAITAAVLTACISLILRDLGRTEKPGVIVFWFTILSLPPLGLAMLFVGKAHDPLTWALLAALGLTGGIGQLCMTGALSRAPISVVLPMDYSMIIWSTLLGALIWGEWPIPTTWIGAIFIIVSGLYIAWREHVRTRRSALA